MLNILPSVDNDVTRELKLKLFGNDDRLGLSYVLYDADAPVGIAELSVGTTSVVHRLAVTDVPDHDELADFFIRALLFRLISVSQNIEIGYLNEEYLQFGFEINNNIMTAPSDKIVFPSGCKG